MPVFTFYIGYNMISENSIIGIILCIAAFVMLIFEFISYFSKDNKE
jgi:hypothetical protein